MHYLKYLASLRASDIHPGGALASRLLLRNLNLRPGARILEIGCGTGLTLARVARLDRVWAVGIDVLPEMIGVAAGRLERRGVQGNASLGLASATRLPFLDGSFDGVYAESVLGIQSDIVISGALREIRRVLAPGGRCVVNDAIWRPAASEQQIAAANQACLSEFGLRQASREPWRHADWLAAIQAAGFQVLSSERLKVHFERWPLPRAERWRARLEDAIERTRKRVVAYRGPTRQRRLCYKDALIRRQDLGQLIESRLFVMTRGIRGSPPDHHDQEVIAQAAKQRPAR